MAQPNNHDAVGRSKSKSKGPPVQRKPLKHRDYEVDLESRLGKTQVVTPIAPLSQQAGYFCSVCKCVVKDSANYLDHINGKIYQRALGMSMRVERASLQQVQERFQLLKRRKDTGSFTEQDFDEQILKQQQEEEERKRQRRERKKEKVVVPFTPDAGDSSFPSLRRRTRDSLCLPFPVIRRRTIKRCEVQVSMAATQIG
ncbi:hypothetical protein ACSBR1_018766 [Camellia fascicularis]